LNINFRAFRAFRVSLSGLSGLSVSGDSSFGTFGFAFGSKMTFGASLVKINLFRLSKLKIN